MPIVKVLLGKPSKFFFRGKEISGDKAYNLYRKGTSFGRNPLDDARRKELKLRKDQVDALKRRGHASASMPSWWWSRGSAKARAEYETAYQALRAAEEALENNKAKLKAAQEELAQLRYPAV